VKKVVIHKNTLKEIYIDKGLSMAKIGKKFHCHPSTIQRLMQKYKIKSRTLSEANKKVFISKQILKKLYYHDKMSTGEIGKLYHCSHATILNRMKVYGIQRRSKLGLRKPIFISKERMKELYLEKKLSISQIARKMKCSRWPLQKLLKKYKIKPRFIIRSPNEISKI
jgi:predicted DNA-binding protein YlxM (UPF0122 family)